MQSKNTSPAASRCLSITRAGLATAIGLALLAGCSELPRVTDYLPYVVRPYRPDVPQGNIVTKDMFDQLREGMSQDQVRFLMGSPLLTDAFHKQRWDYVYALRRSDGTTQNRSVKLWFADGKLERFEAGDLPPEAMADNLILGRKADGETARHGWWF